MTNLSSFKIRLSKLVLLLSDVFALLISGLLSAELAVGLSRQQLQVWLSTQDLNRYWLWGLAASLSLFVFQIRFKHYSERKPFWDELGEILLVILIVAILDLALLALTKSNASRFFSVLVWVCSAGLVPIFRYISRRLLNQFNLWMRPTIIIGDGENANQAIDALDSERAMGLEVVGVIETNVEFAKPLHTTGKRIDLIRKFPLDALSDLVKVPGINFVVATESGQGEIRQNALRRLADLGAEEVSVIPAMRGVPLYGIAISHFFSHEVAILKLRSNLRYWFSQFVKRTFDITLATVLLLILLLPMLWIGLRIMRDGGPCLFVHQRVGRNGKLFPCIKFRTMCVDANKVLINILEADDLAKEQWSREFKLHDDPRVTRIGQFLRKSSLDELPQLINVICGEMSLVGPRPITLEEQGFYADDFVYFKLVRPGMTGLWQVSGRSNTNYETRVYLDTWYVKNWSLWYDIAILFKTIPVVLRGAGAH